MGKMSYIHYLCERRDKDALVEETGSETIANHFIEAHRVMREERDNPEWAELNELADKSIKEYKINPNKAKLDSKESTLEINRLFKDISQPN